MPTIKEYFQDLDEVLSVISDGPAKSFAWRRLRYLESKWNLYVLLNEYRELAEMKVGMAVVFTATFTADQECLVRSECLTETFTMSEKYVFASRYSSRHTGLIAFDRAGRYAHSPLCEHEPKAHVALHQEQDETMSRGKPPRACCLACVRPRP